MGILETFGPCFGGVVRPAPNFRSLRTASLTLHWGLVVRRLGDSWTRMWTLCRIVNGTPRQ
jgi:hypothetical protein